MAEILSVWLMSSKYSSNCNQCSNESQKVIINITVNTLKLQWVGNISVVFKKFAAIEI